MNSEVKTYNVIAPFILHKRILTLKNSNINIKLFTKESFFELFLGSVDKLDVLNISKHENISYSESAIYAAYMPYIKDNPTHEKTKKIKHIKDKYLFNLYIGLMLSIKFGLSSVFREKLKKEQLMTSFYMEREIVGEYLIIVFKADSETPFELIEEIKKELANIEIPEEEINRLKKVWISSEVIMIDNINMSLENIVDDIIEFGDIIPNKVEIFRSLNKKNYDKILSSIDFSNSSTVIIRPKEKE